MFLRSHSIFRRTLADNPAVHFAGWAVGRITDRVAGVIRQGSSLVRFPSQNETPTFDGQQACPPAALPVLFGLFFAQGRERNSRPRVLLANNIKKEYKPWAFRNSYSHLQPQQASQPVGNLWATKLLAAQQLVQARPLLQTVASRKAPHWVQGQTFLPARPTWSTATNLTNGLRPVTIHKPRPAQAFSLRGFCRSTNLFHHQKGQAYVQ